MSQQSAITLLGRRSQRLLTAPGLDHNVLGQIRAQDFIPSHHGFAVLAHDLLYAFVEVGLQFLVVLDSMRALELLYFRIRIPLLSIYFVTTDVEVMIGE